MSKVEENKISGVCVIVLGMHRSGTSALSGALCRLGIEFGDKLLPGEPYNPKGFFEHVDILSINNEILRMLNSSFDDIKPLPLNWHRSEFILPFKDKLINIISRDFKNYEVFGFKDPRISILLPLYLEIVKEMNLDARFVICERADIEIALSIKERIRFSLHDSLLLIKKYKTSIDELIKGQKHVRISMNFLLTDPENALKKIVEDLDLSIEVTDVNMHEVKKFLDNDLKHHNITPEDALFYVARELEKSEQAKKELEGDLSKLQIKLYERSGYADYLDQMNQRLHNTLAHRNHRIQFLEKEALKWDGIDRSYFRSMQAEQNNKELEIYRLRESLSSIKRSFSWKAVFALQKIIDSIIFPGSALRRPYVKFLRWLQGTDIKISKSPLLGIHSVPDLQNERGQDSLNEKVLITPSKLDILFINHEESLTGAPKILLEVAKTAMSLYSVAVLSKQKGGLSGEYQKAFGDRLFYPHEISDEAERHRLARAMLLKFRPALVYANSIISYEYACEAKKLGIPVIFHIHEMASAYDVAIAAEAQSEFSEFADVFLAVSEVTKRDLINIMKVPENKIRLVHEFIEANSIVAMSKDRNRKEVEDMLGISENDRLIVSMGTFDRRKGGDYFIKIAQYLENSAFNDKASIKMLWIGRRPHEHEFLSSVFDKHREAFLYVAETDNPFPFLARADVFFLSSREDPFPLVVLEAMALGKPVVAFAGSGGAAEAVGESIALIDNWDTDKAAKLIYNIATDDVERSWRGAHGQKRQASYEKTFQLEKVFKEIDQIIPRSSVITYQNHG